MSLLSAIAAAVPPVGSPFETVRLFRATPGEAPLAPAPKPVLQYGPSPVTLDPRLYANARSSARPDGDLRPLAAFRDLVDPVPSFSRYYNPSGSSTEQLYESIIQGATIAANNPFTARLIASAKQKFDVNSFANMDGTPGKWRPVYAVPGDWYDLSIQGRFQDLAIDLSARATTTAPTP